MCIVHILISEGIFSYRGHAKFCEEKKEIIAMFEDIRDTVYVTLRDGELPTYSVLVSAGISANAWAVHVVG